MSVGNELDTKQEFQAFFCLLILFLVFFVALSG